MAVVSLIPASVQAQVPPPSITSFAATPAAINGGQSSTLTWATSNASSATLGDGSTTLNVSLSGSVNVTPVNTTTYTLTARNTAGTSVTRTVVVAVNNTPSILSFTASPASISRGESSTLSWSTSNASTVTVSGQGPQAVNGTVVVRPASTTTYTLTATNVSGAVVTRSVTVNVLGIRRLQILLPGESAAPGTPFGKSGEPSAQVAGRSFSVVVNAVDENWDVVGSVADLIAVTSTDPLAALPANVALSGGRASFTITLRSPGTHTVTVTDLTDAAKAPASSAAINVRPDNGAIISVLSFPSGLLDTPNTGGATSQYALANTGGVNTTINLAQTGSFFSQTPTVFTLVPGQIQVVTLTALAQPVGSYEGSSIPSGDGVPSGLTIPVKLLAQTPPDRAPRVVPTLIRIDTNDQTTTGLAEFRNEGEGTATGIIISNVPWLLPQGGQLSINPGATIRVSFTIDRRKRPDGDRPAGSQTARLTFTYLGGTASSGLSFVGILSDRPPTGIATVTLVDTVGARASAAGIPPLGGGEIARFVLGLVHRVGRVSDLSLLNPGTTTLPDFRFYFLPSGVASLLAQAAIVSQLSSNTSFGLGDIVNTVFERNAVSGSVQLRTRAADVMAVQALLLNQSPRGNLGTALSVFTSDKGVIAGQDLVLTGVRRDSNTRTDLYIQETSGVPASVIVEFLDIRGDPVGSVRPPDNLSAFSQIELTDIVPSGAVVIRVTHATGSQGRIVGEAHVSEGGGDTWTIADSTRHRGFSRSEPVLVPLAASIDHNAGTQTRTDLFITNTSAIAATASIEYPQSQRKRRAVGVTATDMRQELRETLTIAPLETRVISDALRASAPVADGRGYVKFTPLSGEFVLTSRTYTFTPGQGGSTGSSVPEVAISAALPQGSSRHISGLEDASPAMVDGRVPGTYRTSVGLIETGGKEATVRLTIRYRHTFSLVSSVVVAHKDLTLRPNQFMMVDDLARAILGSQRDVMGDLHNVQLDVEVSGGEGAVVPYVVTTDNGSEDTFFIPIL